MSLGARVDKGSTFAFTELMSLRYTEKPGPARLASMMNEAGLRLTDVQTAQFWKYHGFLRERNEELNMTRIYEFDAMVLKLYIDSAIVGKLIPLPSPIVDIGSGPGFPGIPLAILHPDVQFILSEGRSKRNDFLRETVQLLGLKNVEVLGHRVAPDFVRPVQAIITRAVETIDETLIRVLHSLQSGGKAIFMKGPDCDEEIAHGEKKAGRYYEKSGDIAYQLLNTENHRRLVVFTRNAVPGPKRAEGEVLQSADNPRFRLWRSLSASRAIRKEKLSITGGKAALEILRLEPEGIVQVILRDGMNTTPEVIGLPTTILSAELFALLDPNGSNMPLVVVAVPEFLTESLPERCIVLGLQNPAEVGAVVRTAAYYGWHDIVLTKEAAHPFHPDALQQAGAGALRVRYHTGISVNDLPVTLQGGVRLSGQQRVPSEGPVRLFVGAQDKPAWPVLGRKNSDLDLEPGAALAAAIG